MTTRRRFLAQTAVASLMTAPSIGASAPRIKALLRREETTLRHGGVGDNWHMSWAADDRQFVALCDGTGWSGKPTGYYNSRLFAINGGPHNPIFRDVPGYPDLPRRTDEPSYYGFGTLALDGRIYQYLSTFNYGFYFPDRTVRTDLRYVGAKLIYSPDNGRTWCNQDGSTPVVWESWAERSRESMIFFEEEQEAFSLTTLLQMGKNYEHNRDGYVYVYAPNGNTEGTMNELVLARVPKGQILHRSAYEFFAGSKGAGRARWSKDIRDRTPVHRFPRGWVNSGNHPNAGDHPYAWHPSVVYNAPLGIYLMANWGMGCGPNGLWFGKPSYLGFWVAHSPWGPWAQIHEEPAWLPTGDIAARAYQPQIAPKWIAPDGRSFWLVWTEYQITDQEAFERTTKERQRISSPTAEDEVRWAEARRRYRPYYAFNTQRLDLLL